MGNECFWEGRGSRSFSLSRVFTETARRTRRRPRSLSSVRVWTIFGQRTNLSQSSCGHKLTLQEWRCHHSRAGVALPPLPRHLDCTLRQSKPSLLWRALNALETLCRKCAHNVPEDAPRNIVEAIHG